MYNDGSTFSEVRQLSDGLYGMRKRVDDKMFKGRLALTQPMIAS